MTLLSVLIPAHNEEAYLPACLEALLASDMGAGEMEVLVIANGCTDGTAQVARAFQAEADKRGWRLEVLELAQGSKIAAWNAGEAAAKGELLAYLDADVTVSTALMGQIAAALDVPLPRYASGQPRITVEGDWTTRHYTRFWKTTPFLTTGVPGFGLFAMNRAGRARWGAWPQIISDDTFARLHFTPEDRLSVPARYDWPMIEGFRRLVQVRRRQDIGVAEIERLYPQLVRNNDPSGEGLPLWRRALRDPLGFGVYGLVRATIRLPVLRSSNPWVRGR